MNEKSKEDQVKLAFTERADELLHMILDLKQDKKEVDLFRMQTLVLNMYKDELELVHCVSELEKELERRKRKIIEIPKFMSKKGSQVV